MEISLDSVLQKATELVDSLKQCKAKAAAPLSPSEGPSPWGTSSGCSPLYPSPALPASPLYPSPAQPASPLQSPMLSSAAATAAVVDTAGQWQKLTAYIVSLEKEVQYYKQMVQDVQAKQSSKSQEETSLLARPEGRNREKKEEANAGYWKQLLESDPENHILLLVFSHLTPQELSQAALVCRKWYTMSRHPLLWKELVMAERVVEPQVKNGPCSIM